MAIAIAVILLVIGSVLFHFLSPWYFTPLASNWDTIDLTVDITFWVTGVVFVVVNLFMAWCIVRFRHKKGQNADYEPENKKLEGWLTAVTTGAVFIAGFSPALERGLARLNRRSCPLPPVRERSSTFRNLANPWR